MPATFARHTLATFDAFHAELTYADLDACRGTCAIYSPLDRYFLAPFSNPAQRAEVVAKAFAEFARIIATRVPQHG
jgi:hypothetical protein